VNSAPSVNALKYVVTDAGQPLCSTSGTDCPIAKLYTIVTAPKIEVQAIGANSTKSTLAPARLVVDRKVVGTLAHFAVGKYDLSASDKKLIDSVVKFAKTYGYTKVDATGHADIQQGMDNQALSDNRAKVAGAYFKSKDPAATVITVGYSDKKPIADSFSQKGLALNRRASVTLIP